MRDDIHKSVPRPRAVQQWVKMTVSDADRLAGRAALALDDAMRDSCRREISPTFVRSVLALLDREPDFFEPLQNLTSPREAGGYGQPLERAVLRWVKRLHANGVAGPEVLETAIANALHERLQADIRATAAVLPINDAKSHAVLLHMQSDARAADVRAIAHDVCVNGRAQAPARKAQRLDADENLIGAM